MSNSNSDPSDKPEKANANEFRRSTKSINERPHSALKNSKDLKVLSQSLFEKVIVDESCTVYPSMEYSLGDDAKLMTLSPKLDTVAYVEEKVHKVIIATITISDHDHRGITIEHLTDFFTVPQFKTAISSKGCFYYIASTERHVSVYSPGDVNIASSTYLGNGPTYTGIKTISGYRVALTWSTDRMVRFWHVNHTGFTLRELGSFSYGKAIPNVVEAFSTADYCITGLSDGQIDFRNLSSLSLRSFQPFTKPISGLALSPRNQYISACSEGTVTLISLKTGYISWNKFTKPVGTGFILKFVYFFGELNGVGAIVIYELPEGRQELLKPVLTLTYGCQRIPESVATTRNMIGVRFKSTKEEAKVGPAGNSQFFFLDAAKPPLRCDASKTTTQERLPASTTTTSASMVSATSSQSNTGAPKSPILNPPRRLFPTVSTFIQSTSCHGSLTCISAGVKLLREPVPKPSRCTPSLRGELSTRSEHGASRGPVVPRPLTIPKLPILLTAARSRTSQTAYTSDTNSHRETDAAYLALLQQRRTSGKSKVNRLSKPWR